MRIIDKKILNKEQLNGDYNLKKLIFFRIDPEDKKEALKTIYNNISNKLWIQKFSKEYIRLSFNTRVDKTLDKLSKSLVCGEDDKITSDAGEYLVSELSRETIIRDLNYTDIPLAELRKEQTSGNPGFDFHSESNENIIIFGEAKYLSRDNAYNSALSQIVDFISDKKDIAELVDLEEFVKQESLENCSIGVKGFAAAFAVHQIDTATLLKNILKNSSLKNLLQYEELILVAVNINE